MLRVADGEIIGRDVLLYAGNEANAVPEYAGPTKPSTSLLAATAADTGPPIAGSPWSSTFNNLTS